MLEALAGDAPAVLVTAEAGLGKSSLLWRVHALLAATGFIEPLFIKGSLLVGRGTQPPVLAPEDLLLGIQAIAARGRPPVLLIDTVDALVTAASKEAVEDLLSEALTTCRVVLASRREEAGQLRAVAGAEVELLPYPADELHGIIVRHFEQFGPTDQYRDASAAANDLVAAAANGLPIQEVLNNPLALRMLLEVARGEISPEMNIAGVYSAYWRERVERDARAGGEVTGGDLGDAARAAAAALAAAGLPEVPEESLRADVGALGADVSHLDQLVMRGVLTRSRGGELGDAMLRFFHQRLEQQREPRTLPRPRHLHQMRLVLQALGSRRGASQPRVGAAAGRNQRSSSRFARGCIAAQAATTIWSELADPLHAS